MKNRETVSSILAKIREGAKESQAEPEALQYLKSIDEGIKQIVSLLEQLLERDYCPPAPEHL